MLLRKRIRNLGLKECRRGRADTVSQAVYFRISYVLKKLYGRMATSRGRGAKQL